MKFVLNAKYRSAANFPKALTVLEGTDLNLAVLLLVHLGLLVDIGLD